MFVARNGHDVPKIMVLTYRRDLADRLKLGVEVLGENCPDLLVGGSLAWAEKLLKSRQPQVFVFDAGFDASLVAKIPRLVGKLSRKVRLVLVTENQDAMYERSVLKCGYDHCVDLLEAMRTDFLRVLEKVARRQDSSSPAERTDFAGCFGLLKESVAVTDSRGRLVYANAKFSESVGQWQEDLRGRFINEFFPELSGDFFAKAPVAGQRLLEMRRASGNCQALKVQLMRLQLDNGMGLAFIF